MGYRKFKASQLFTGHQFAPEGTVLLTDETGQIEGLLPEAEAGSEIEEIEGILCPGFINAHCHLELSHMAGKIPPGTGMVNFLLAVMQQRQAEPETILSAISRAEDDMLNNGIVAVGDICNTRDSLPQKQANKLNYTNFIECSGFVPAGAATRFENARQLLQQFSATGNSTIVPHSPYSVSPELFQLINQSSTGKISTMHNQESKEENEFFISGKSAIQQLFKTLNIDIEFFRAPGKTSLQAVWPWLQNSAKLILVHNTLTSQDDLDAIQQDENNEQEIFFCLCPNANLYINNNLPPVDLLMENNCKIVLGTDSLSSNYQLSILEEIRTLLKSIPNLSMATALKWATLNGADALGITGDYGSFEKGKRPGLVQIDEWISRRIL